MLKTLFTQMAKGPLAKASKLNQAQRALGIREDTTEGRGIPGDPSRVVLVMLVTNIISDVCW